MDQVTFTAHFVPSYIHEEEPFPPAEEQTWERRERINASIMRKWTTIGDPSRILSGVNVEQNTIRYHYLSVHSIHATPPPFDGMVFNLTQTDLLNINGRVQQATFRVRNGMLYQNSNFCEEWCIGLSASLGSVSSGGGTYLGVKIIIPLIASIPCIYSCLEDRKKRKVTRMMEANVPLKALAGIIAQLCLSILWCITLGLFSERINYLRGDVERWENGHSDDVGAKCKTERVAEMPYLMPDFQPITTFNARRVQPTANGNVDLMTTECISDVQRKMLAHLIAEMTLADHRHFTVPMTENVMNSIYRTAS